MAIPTILATDPLSTIAENLRPLGQGAVHFTRDHSPGIGLVVLDNPTRHNSFSGKMMAEFRDIVLHLEKDPDDLHTYSDLAFAKEYAGSQEAREAVNRLMHDTLSLFSRLPLITMASVSGPALGGGTEFLTAFDFVCMNASTFIRFVQTRRGFTSPWGGARRLISRIGRKNTLLLLAGAPIITAPIGQKIGLVDRVVETTDAEAYDACLSAAVEFMQPFVVGDNKHDRAPLSAVRGMKQLVVRADLDADLDYEMKIFAKAVGSPNL
ncbi:enoyl CoA hydratase domain-containing protein 1 [Apophysomyces sp. BC1034]|nr:enoyl CoA hydratase domain-containing protein 1 [Apophysomyces sp. BC1015]KAG0181166.1 enoyl CoA hydratase domain-containing protein 1 [Apophysomyces sp. BC1021]KAG0186676.1 enoyl CoA hydratase domain-containing protein 1 [Apophysomyces sp. BC1034]